jgi:serine/threonine protein kinase
MDTPGHHYESIGDSDYHRFMSGEGHSVSMDESAEHSDYAAELDVKMVLYTADAPDWNNAGIVSYVLQFLLGDNGEASNATASSEEQQHDIALAASTSRSGRNVRRTRNRQNTAEDSSSYRLVSKAWALGSYRLLARHLSHAENSPALPWSRWARFVSRYSWGRFLAAGACKSVYCVQNQHNSGALEAISVMDVNDLEHRDMGDAVTQELEISLACSSLASLHVCPNLVQVYSLFRSDCPVPPSLWNSASKMPPPLLSSPTGSSARCGGGGEEGDRPLARAASVVVPKKQTMELGCFQYIRMEYCGGGDLEDFVRDHRLLPVPTVRTFLFQMCFAMYCCRDQLALRHFDIKLLNFMVTQGSTLLPPEVAASGVRRAGSPFDSLCALERSNTVDMRVGIGHQVYCLPLLLQGKELVKMADFGTSVVGLGGLGDPISVQQFTTLENVPPEFLLLGSGARQGFSADTFPMGLCFLHLLTGYEPYEILMQDVYCPPYLIHKLSALWSPDDVEDPFYIIREAVDTSVFDNCSDDGGDDSAAAHSAGYEGALLAHTLYRYLVLFGALRTDDVDLDSPVWAEVRHSLAADDGSSHDNNEVSGSSGGGGGNRRFRRRFGKKGGGGGGGAAEEGLGLGACRRRYVFCCVLPFFLFFSLSVSLSLIHLLLPACMF